MTRPKSRPGNRFFVDEPPRDPSPCLFLCRQPGSSHCLGILPTMRATTRSAKYSLFISHGGCPPCPPMLSAAPWSWRQGRWHHAGFGEMFDGGASQRENSVADDLPDLAWVANTPRHSEGESLREGEKKRLGRSSSPQNGRFGGRATYCECSEELSIDQARIHGGPDNSLLGPGRRGIS